MKSIEELLRNLARPDVLEFGLVTNRLPSINVGGRFEPVDDVAPTTDRVKQMLIAMGGGRFIETLSDRPVQWTTRLDGVGVIAVAAIMRKDIVQARFTVARREAAQQQRPGAAPQAPPAAVPAMRPATGAHQHHPPPQAFSQTQQGTGAPQQQPQQQPSPINPILSKTMSSPPPPMTPPMAQGGAQQLPGMKPGASSGKQPVAPVVVAAPPPPPPAPTPVAAQVPAPPAPAAPRDGSITNEWEEDDDNEPTVQTLSPQTPQNTPQNANAPLPAAGMPPPDEPRPKPPRRPEEVRQGSTTAPTATAPTSAPGSQTQMDAQPPMPDALPPAREPSAIPPPPKTEPKAASSSGQLEDVDVEITTNDGSALAEAEAAAADDADGIEHTVEVIPKAPKAEEAPESRPQALPVPPKPETKAEPKAEAKPEVKADALLSAKTDPSLSKAEPQMSGIPSTTPSGIHAAPDKDRPRVDGGAALDAFLAMAATAQATDLLMSGGRPVMLRIGSELVARTQSLSPDHVERIVKEVLPPRLREALDGEGSCDFAIDHQQHGRFRVNLSRHRGGTTLAIRVLGREFPSIRALGLPDIVASATHHKQGFVLVTGPAGHGKTTTLAALVDAINANADAPRHVYTIEDPIEHVHPKRRGMVTQREIGTHVKSWAHALDDALVSDVDVVVIGDLRDEGALRAAVTACEAGRLVLATMSGTSAARAIDRIIERFPASERPRTRSTLASAVRMVIGQRLVPSTDRTRVHVALETLPGTSGLYTLIRDGRSNEIGALQQRARSLGFMRLDDSLSELVRAQKVTLDVARQFAESPADLAAKKG